MSLLPTAMRDPDMQPLGLPLRLMAPPQPDQRAENMAKWFGKVADDERAAFDRRLALRRPLGAAL